MYSRSYYDTDGIAHTLSGSYDGTYLRDEPPPVHTPRTVSEGAISKEVTKCSPQEESIKQAECAKEVICDMPDGGLLDRLIARARGILPIKLLPDKFGLEELLIIGLALYLFFTKSGDKEFALMLIALIFIT
ncbi:MAG: hypothetical protein IJY01_00700 [Clostridia bacterium]|nr:hypothetical protein [Clostridia bacterium]